MKSKNEISPIGVVKFSEIKKCPKCGGAPDPYETAGTCAPCTFLDELQLHLSEDWTRYAGLKREAAELIERMSKIRDNLRYDEEVLRKCLRKLAERREQYRRKR